MARPDASRALDLRRLKLADLVGLDVEHQEHVAREAAAAEAVAGRQRRGRIPIDADRRHLSRVRRHRTRDSRVCDDAIAMLDPLPKAAEAVHIVMSGSFHAWSFVPALCQLFAPAVVDELLVATLSYNQANADSLFELLDTGRVKRCTCLASLYFRDTDPAVWEHLERGLQKRGQRVGAARNHAKILAAATSDSRHYLIESSANLRSCNNIEQATCFNSRELFDFHAAWIRDALAHGDQPP